jgi:hypothetical protein
MFQPPPPPLLAMNNITRNMMIRKSVFHSGTHSGIDCLLLSFQNNPKKAFNHRFAQIKRMLEAGGRRRLIPQTSILKRTAKVLSAFICVHLRPIAEFGIYIKYDGYGQKNSISL